MFLRGIERGDSHEMGNVSFFFFENPNTWHKQFIGKAM